MTVQWQSAVPAAIDRRGRGGILSLSDAGAQAALSNLTIQNGFLQGGKGAGIYDAGTLTIFDGTIFANSATDGGGIFIAGTLTVSNSDLTATAEQRRRHVRPRHADIDDSTVYGDRGSNGGSIYGAGTLTISNSAIGGIAPATAVASATLAWAARRRSSTAPSMGIAPPTAGIYNTSRTWTISDSTFGAGSASAATPSTTWPTATFQNSIAAYRTADRTASAP